MNQVAVMAAEILNISEEDFLTAFQTAMSNNMPEAPDGEGQQPPQGEPPESMGEPTQTSGTARRGAFRDATRSAGRTGSRFRCGKDI
jgi:hypothetical protein